MNLLELRSPTAVRRLVVSAVVDAVDAPPCRGLSHVGEKVLELFPSLANGDSAPSVILPAFLFGVFAAVDHSDPAAPCFRSPGNSSSVSVAHIRSSRGLSLKAPAAFCVSTNKVGRDRIDTVAAVAERAGHPVSATCAYAPAEILRDSKPSKSASWLRRVRLDLSHAFDYTHFNRDRRVKRRAQQEQE